MYIYLGPWQALLMSPKGQNPSEDGFVNMKISFISIASFGSLAPSTLALLFCFSLIRHSLSIVTIYIYASRLTLRSAESAIGDP